MAVDSNALAVSLVEAAVRAAVTAGAPRRTVAATAAAVATAMAGVRGGDGTLVGATEPSVTSERRKKKNRKKKERRQAAKVAASQEKSPDGNVATAMEEEVANLNSTGKDAASHGDGNGGRPDPRGIARQFEKDATTAASPPRKVAFGSGRGRTGNEAMLALSPEVLRAHNESQPGESILPSLGNVRLPRGDLERVGSVKSFTSDNTMRTRTVHGAASDAGSLRKD
mmetsp:Transcript_118172/g.208873  ORF Transcript_118172/g.208873 Transcript_118172/m.208873 type:complete len:226 (-) Transcript_118172:476-1153(-)